MKIFNVEQPHHHADDTTCLRELESSQANLSCDRRRIRAEISVINYYSSVSATTRNIGQADHMPSTFSSTYLNYHRYLASWAYDSAISYDTSGQSDDFLRLTKVLPTMPSRDACLSTFKYPVIVLHRVTPEASSV